MPFSVPDWGAHLAGHLQKTQRVCLPWSSVPRAAQGLIQAQPGGTGRAELTPPHRRAEGFKPTAKHRREMKNLPAARPGSGDPGWERSSSGKGLRSLLPEKMVKESGEGCWILSQAAGPPQQLQIPLRGRGWC